MTKSIKRSHIKKLITIYIEPPFKVFKFSKTDTRRCSQNIAETWCSMLLALLPTDPPVGLILVHCRTSNLLAEEEPQVFTNKVVVIKAILAQR